MTTDAAPETELSDAADDARVQWRGDVVPYSSRFEDTYFSDVDGRAETRAVFVGGNRLPERWRVDQREFLIGELGFGTGLNFLETLTQWRAHATSEAVLRYVSFEKYPLSREELFRALRPWPDLDALARTVLQQWPGDGRVFRATEGTVSLEVHFGDAREVIDRIRVSANAWYLDGFSPANNPELWDEALLRKVFERTVSGGTFSTYTAAGWVRRNLQAAGFEVDRVPGFGRKRERLQGIRPAAA